MSSWAKWPVVIVEVGRAGVMSARTRSVIERNVSAVGGSGPAVSVIHGECSRRGSRYPPGAHTVTVALRVARAAVLGPGSQRGTRLVRFALYAGTTAVRMFTECAARIDPSPALLAVTENRPRRVPTPATKGLGFLASVTSRCRSRCVKGFGRLAELKQESCKSGQRRAVDPQCERSNNAPQPARAQLCRAHNRKQTEDHATTKASRDPGAAAHNLQHNMPANPRGSN